MRSTGVAGAQKHRAEGAFWGGSCMWGKIFGKIFLGKKIHIFKKYADTGDNGKAVWSQVDSKESEPPHSWNLPSRSTFLRKVGLGGGWRYCFLHAVFMVSEHSSRFSPIFSDEEQPHVSQTARTPQTKNPPWRRVAPTRSTLSRSYNEITGFF